MPLGGMVGRVPLHAPRGFLPYPPVKDTGMISAVLPNEPAVLVEPANLQIAKVPRVLRPLVLDGLLPIDKVVTRVPVHGMLPGDIM